MPRPAEKGHLTPRLILLFAIVTAAFTSAITTTPSPSPGPAWESLPPLAGGARQEHPVVALAGEIYVLAGFNGVPQIVVTVEAYDPVANTWRTNVASINDGVMDVPMHHANVAVAGGKIYIVGFLTGNLFTPDGRVFEYDPGLNTWTQKTSMPAGTERGGSQVAPIREHHHTWPAACAAEQ